MISGLVLFGSFAMRTPNDITIPKDDYEVSVGFKSDRMYFKRDWERELGENYIDDEMWYEWKPENFYFKPQYINKESHDLEKMNIQLDIQECMPMISSKMVFQ